MLNIPMSFDESYQMIKLWDILRDMDMDLTDEQTAVFERIQTGDYLVKEHCDSCLLYTSPSPRDRQKSRMPSSA